MAETYKCGTNAKSLPISDLQEGERFEEKFLIYDSAKYKEVPTIPLNTLQVFITDRCNLRCDGCFYAHNLGRDEMSLGEYKQHVNNYLGTIDRVTLLGGEPTLHKNLSDMLRFNLENKVKSTIYTNGKRLKDLENIGAEILDNTSIRFGVYGFSSGERPLTNVQRTKLPITMVYMLRKNNIAELMQVALAAETDFNCKGFYISSIREIGVSGSFWRDSKDTIPLNDYFQIVQDFVANYEGNLDLHIARRGVIKSRFDVDVADGDDDSACSRPNKCRFGNIFPDEKKIICPFDISKKLYSPKLVFNQRKCNKNKNCLLTKIVLKNQN